MHPETNLVFRRAHHNNAQDVSFLYKVRTNESVDKFLSCSPPKNYLQHVSYLFDNKLTKSFFIFRWDNLGIDVGYSQVTMDIDQEIELGWALLPDYWSMGFGKEMVKDTVDMVVKFFPIDKDIVLFVKEDNHRAIHIYEKNKFKKTFNPEIGTNHIKMRLER